MLEEETLQNDSGTVDMTTDYVAAIQELKQNSVSKADYDKLKAENKKLLDAVVSGEQIAVATTESESIQDLRNQLANYDANSMNLDVATTALKLRTKLLESGEIDPFVPHGTQYNPTQLDYEKAHRVATILQDCVDRADGDPVIFQNELRKVLR